MVVWRYKDSRWYRGILFFVAVMQGYKKKGITLVELLIVVVILWFSLASIIGLINLGIRAVDRTRADVIAINLAREGVEWVFQIRNTNRQRRWWSKDACRLKINPLVSNPSWCINDPRMQSGYYTIFFSGQDTNRYYVMQEVWGWWLDLRNYNATRDESFALCQTDGVWEPCAVWQVSVGNIKYYRQVAWQWLFDKTTQVAGWTRMNCTTGNGPWCADGRAKEYRFCVDVQYQQLWIGAVQLCSMITNFAE